MTIYEFLKKTKPETITNLIKTGYLSLNVWRDVQIYDKMKTYMATNKASLHKTTLYIVSLMKEEIKTTQVKNIYKRLNKEL